MFLGMVIFGLLHGLVLLPCLMYAVPTLVERVAGHRGRNGQATARTETAELAESAPKSLAAETTEMSQTSTVGAEAAIELDASPCAKATDTREQSVRNHPLACYTYRTESVSVVVLPGELAVQTLQPPVAYV